MNLSKPQIGLILGDTVVLALVTMYGITSHELEGSAAEVFSRTFLPWFSAWFIMGSFAGLFPTDSESLQINIFRPFFGMILASPFAALMRAFILGANIIPIFIVAFGGICAIAMAVWRAFYFGVVIKRLSNG